MTTTPSNATQLATDAQEKTSAPMEDTTPISTQPTTDHVAPVEDASVEDTTVDMSAFIAEPPLLEQDSHVELDAVTGHTASPVATQNDEAENQADAEKALSEEASHEPVIENAATNVSTASTDIEEYEVEEGTGLAAFDKVESEEQADSEDAPHEKTSDEPSTAGKADSPTIDLDSIVEDPSFSTPPDASEYPQPKRKIMSSPSEDPEEEPMTLLDHLTELRVRLVRCFIAIALGFVVCYSFAERIFNELMVPLVSAMPPDSKLIFTALPEAFFVYMQVAFVAATFLVSPYIFYQVWSFISPGLYENEKKGAIPIAFFSASFFIGGAAFCYYQVFPYAFQFFMGFATDLILPMPSLSEYLGFALKMLIAFGLIFEMPLFTFFLARIGIINASMMRKSRKYAVLCMFIVAALLTPPDVFSQTLMAGPMILLYELSIFIAVFVGKKKQEEKEEEKAEADRPLQGD